MDHAERISERLEQIEAMWIAYRERLAPIAGPMWAAMEDDFAWLVTRVKYLRELVIELESQLAIEEGRTDEFARMAGIASSAMIRELDALRAQLERVHSGPCPEPEPFPHDEPTRPMDTPFPLPPGSRS